eukprot:IDg14601t1
MMKDGAVFVVCTAFYAREVFTECALAQCARFCGVRSMHGASVPMDMILRSRYGLDLSPK